MKDINIFIHPLGPWPRHCRPGASTQHSRYIVCHANTCVKASYARKGFGPWPITRCKHIKSPDVPYVMTMTQPRLMKRVASILLASGPTWRPAPLLRSTLPHSHLYSSSKRFPVVPSLTLGSPHKRHPRPSSVQHGDFQHGLRPPLTRSVMPCTALCCTWIPRWVCRWSGWCSSPNFASILLAPDADDLTICSGGCVPAQGTKDLLSSFAMVLSLVQVVRSMARPLIYSRGARAWMYP
jgi:hypothetical protein